MLAGHPPFDEGGLGEHIYKHMHAEPPDLRKINPDVSPGLWAVLKRMLAKAPGARYQTPVALLERSAALARTDGQSGTVCLLYKPPGGVAATGRAFERLGGIVV